MPEIEPAVVDPEIQRIVDAARDVWVRRLIDHSRANSLLFYRDLKVGTLELIANSDVVSDLMAGNAQTVEELVRSVSEFQNINPLLRARVDAETARKVRGALIALQRKALTNREEKGIETLHLALGMATWPALDGGRPYDSPVLLLPARIEARGRTGEDLRVSVAGEPQLNPVLAYVLAENYAVRLDASAVLQDCTGEDESGQWRVNPDRLFSHIQRAAVTVPDFEVKQRAVLANFQFAKMAMVEDLKKNSEVMKSSRIIAAIAGHMASRRELAEASVNIEPAQLDERPASDDYLVLDADSTQQRAIVAVGKGQSCVVQGPPGTGKSQTIANLIAQSVGEGRRVLFVAEKRAALDAVVKRLSHPEVNLGHLVLDLHGAAVSRKEVMARLAHSLDQIRNALPVDGVESVHRQFEARRKQLNEHSRRVNVVRQPTALSVNRMIGMLLRLPATAKSGLRIRGETLTQLTPGRVDELKQVILEGAANPRLLLGTDPSPWNNGRITDGRRAQDALDLAKAAFGLTPDFESALGRLVQETGVSQPTTLDDVGELLVLLRDVRRILRHYSSDIFSAHPGELRRALEPATRGVIGRAWALATNAAYRSARKRILALRREKVSSTTLPQEAQNAEDVLRRWRALGAHSELPVDARAAAALASVYDALTEAVRGLGDIVVVASPLNRMQLAALSSRLRALADDQSTPYRLPGVHAIRSRLGTAGLASFLGDLREHDVAAEYWPARFEYVWLYSALEHVLAADPALASFSGRTHDQLVAEFIRLDRERVQLASNRVRRLHGERAIEAMNRHFDQSNLVRTEARKRSRHIPLRELLARAPDVLTRIAPCWVASPLSVSQLLDGAKRHFDIVVFDEASQILQEEGVPSLYRAEQVVVAGDRHQLPPTTFFATAFEGEDEIEGGDDDTRDAVATATAAIGGFESLLETLDAFLPNSLLEWHYRSEDERLITFSNSNVYSGHLVTFPSAHGHEAMKHVLVSHDASIGGQEESASREVDEVVRQVLTHAESRSGESLGVITMGIKHANRIQAALDRALELRSDVAEFFSLEREERFFVKNLETVQGDERDAIILSIGYGKLANGDLPHRFGPLTQDVGYRRLNVAITRAKRRISVVSSFSHQEIDLNRSGSRGVRLLKSYLEYAASGGRRLGEEELAGDIALNPFEADIRDALESRGIKTRPQFGASRYRIDLVAMHPTKPGRPVLAIECDGASYHSGATARDRDRLRQAHLQRLGWRFFRIWSPDWFNGREAELERALDAYRDAVRRADHSDLDASIPASRHPVESAPQQDVGRERGRRPQITSRDTIDDFSDRELMQIFNWVLSDGQLRTDEELIREVFLTLPFDRMGSRIRERLTTLVRNYHSRRSS